MSRPTSKTAMDRRGKWLVTYCVTECAKKSCGSFSSIGKNTNQHSVLYTAEAYFVMVTLLNLVREKGKNHFRLKGLAISSMYSVSQKRQKCSLAFYHPQPQYYTHMSSIRGTDPNMAPSSTSNACGANWFLSGMRSGALPARGQSMFCIWVCCPWNTFVVAAAAATLCTISLQTVLLHLMCAGTPNSRPDWTTTERVTQKLLLQL